MSVPPYALAAAQGMVDRLAQADADVLGRVVVVDPQVTLAGNVQVNKRVAGEKLQHVIEKSDTGRDLGSALAVEIEPQANVGLAGRADDLGDAMRLVLIQGSKSFGFRRQRERPNDCNRSGRLRLKPLP